MLGIISKEILKFDVCRVDIKVALEKYLSICSYLVRGSYRTLYLQSWSFFHQRFYSLSAGFLLSVSSALLICLTYDWPVSHDSVSHLSCPLTLGLIQAGVNFSVTFKLVYPWLPTTHLFYPLANTRWHQHNECKAREGLWVWQEQSWDFASLPWHVKPRAECVYVGRWGGFGCIHVHMKARDWH